MAEPYRVTVTYRLGLALGEELEAAVRITSVGDTRVTSTGDRRVARL